MSLTILDFKAQLDFVNLWISSGDEDDEDFFRIERMIDNVAFLVQGTMNQKPPKELLEKVDPLGWFEEMKTIPSLDVSSQQEGGAYDDLYKTILVDTPIAPYFQEFVATSAVQGGGAGDGGRSSSSAGGASSEMSQLLTQRIDLGTTGYAWLFFLFFSELFKAFLKKCWLEDFYKFCKEELQGSTSSEDMEHILMVEKS
jgi:V-type H+-transporting ATPase subunit d